MGYVRNVVYKLRFEDDDPQFEGLVIRARSAPVSTLMELGSLAELPQEELMANGMAAMRQLCDGFGKALVSWNVEEAVDKDGNPADPDDPEAQRREVPATTAGLLTQDFDFVIAIILTWMETIAGAATPLGKRSPGIGTIQPGLIPMEPLSENQAS